MQDFHDLLLMINSRVPIIVVESFEERRVVDMVRRIGMKKGMPVYQWSITEGLKRLEFEDVPSQKHTSEPDQVLGQIKSTSQPGIYLLCDFHPYLKENPKIIRLMKEVAMDYDALGHTLVLVSHELQVPPEVKRFTASFNLSLPDEDQLLAIVRQEAARWSESNRGKKVRTDNATLQKLVRNLRGMTRDDAKRLARGVIFDDGAITDDDLPEINRAKFQLMDMDGVLHFEYDTEHFANVGGLRNLKRWLEERRKVFETPDTKLDKPKGIMLLGIQGGGKSLAAKAVAGAWGLPLLRLDFGSLYNKFYGESEKNLREVLKLADLMAPCVLWMDEVEKGISINDTDGGTAQRLLGTLLTWMAERKSETFIVATSNDISRLPPELVRKGRLDEIFFVDLPAEDVREDIFRIHLKLRGLDEQHFDVPKLARLSEDFTGAEIEQAVVSALYSANARHEPLTTTHIAMEINRTCPLAVTMAEQIQGLRSWAQGRAVLAD